MARPDRASWDEIEEVAEWLPAIVPGNVRADLVRAGRLPDLNFGCQFRASRWVDDHCWWLVRDLELGVSATERVHLVLRGVDYISDLFLNGHHLDRHEGMFSPQVHEITGLLQSKNRLAVRILGSRWLPADRSSPWERLLNGVEAHIGGMPADFPQRRDTVKCQMGFGWDFAPPLRTMGIWDDVHALVCDGVYLREILVRSHLGDGTAALLVELELDADQARAVRIEYSLAPENFAGRSTILEVPADLAAGPNRCRVEMEVAEPRLWWPWDQGRPDLYRLVVRLLDGERTLDADSRLVGLRQLTLETQEENWTLRVNGRAVYARGANWVPASITPGEVRQTDYRELLSLARRANMNLLRVWGGGLREKRAFYDLCDRMGLLVWQEFPFACAFVTRFPRSRGFLAQAEAEARATVRDLRGHPCLALWCGGNEFSPGRNASLVAVLGRIVAEEDPTRSFLPASPNNGDSHYWRVWHDFHPPSAYRQDEAAFASEFGLQAPPAVEVLRRFVPQDEQWPPGRSWTSHGAGLSKLWRYARPFLAGREANLEAFVQASQQAQARGLQIAIEHYRRRKAQGCGGALVWQLNEPWPAISWSLLDFYRQPKPAYRAVQRAFEPLLVSLEFPLVPLQAGQDLEIAVWLVNDRPEPVGRCRLEVQLWDPAGQPVERFVLPIDTPAATAEVVARLRWTLTWATTEGGGGRLSCRLLQGSATLAANDYDLGHHDDIRPGLRQRLWAWLRGLVFAS